MIKKVFIPFSFLVSVLLFTSCEKELVRNEVPKAEAGDAKFITLPIDEVALSGSGTDSDGRVVAYLWSQVSGPAASIIVNPGSPNSTVKHLKEGKYTFQLMVTDAEGATGVDSVQVTVNPSAIKTLTLQPFNNPTEFRISLLNGVDASLNTAPSLEADAWTTGGIPWLLRGLLRFDLSTIPSTATIKKATLSLYSDPAPLTGNLIDANFGNDNSFVIQQAGSNWSAATVNWFNQPTGITSNEIIIPTTTASKLDLNVDVTGMVAAMINDNANYGFIIKLSNEIVYNSRIFVSSRNTANPTMRPRIVIEYQ